MIATTEVHVSRMVSVNAIQDLVEMIVVFVLKVTLEVPALNLVATAEMEIALLMGSVHASQDGLGRIVPHVSMNLLVLTALQYRI
jgi:hypothetical protein